ncbi:hypothetical protein B0H16DRAFT_1862416, partial [Mycena metata]
GSAVIRGLLEDGTFTPRAITRNPDSEMSLKLKAQGVEVVKGDALDKDSLVEALRGSEAVFGVHHRPHSPFESRRRGPNEIVQGKNLVDAAKEVGIKFFIFSSGPDVEKFTGGKYKNLLVTEQKLVVEEYLKSSGIPYASLLPGTFLENFWKYRGLQKTATGFDIAVPIFGPTDANAFTWIGRDYPATVLALLKNYEDPSRNILGRSYHVINTVMTYPEIAAMAAKALGAEVTFTTLPTSGVAYRDEIFKVLAEYAGEYYIARHPDLVELGVKFGSVQEFMDTELKSHF